MLGNRSCRFQNPSMMQWHFYGFSAFPRNKKKTHFQGFRDLWHGEMDMLEALGFLFFGYAHFYEGFNKTLVEFAKRQVMLTY